MEVKTSYLFKDRKGNTSLSRDEMNGLKLSHISRMKELDEAEALNIAEGLEFLRNYRKDDYLEIAFAKKLHKKLFGDVWRWAGEFRKTEKNIGISPFNIQTELYKHLEQTKYWIEYESYDWEEIGARFHHKLVYIHPFSNGNGRWARIYTEFLYWKNGKSPPLWHPDMDPAMRRELYIHALRDADNKKFDKLKKFLDN
ncbi:MAG: mobile mystery protein B [Halobacteriovoraceae bacterium]|nr:mobile mystery protein B [Halobacteriovoraceae bacterium]